MSAVTSKASNDKHSKRYEIMLQPGERNGN